MARKKRRDDHEHHEHEPHDHEPHHHEPEMRGRRSYGTYISNWNNYAAPTHKKLAIAARNLFISRWHNRLVCCGHPGQPGC